MCAYARFVKSQTKTTVTAADGWSLAHFRHPNRAPVTMEALRGRPPLQPLVRSNDLDGRADSMAEIGPDRPRVAEPRVLTYVHMHQK
jgi:hypothetical protein